MTLLKGLDLQRFSLGRCTISLPVGKLTSKFRFGNSLGFDMNIDIVRIRFLILDRKINQSLFMTLKNVYRHKGNKKGFTITVFYKK